MRLIYWAILGFVIGLFINSITDSQIKSVVYYLTPMNYQSIQIQDESGSCSNLVQHEVDCKQNSLSFH